MLHLLKAVRRSEAIIYILIFAVFAHAGKFGLLQEIFDAKEVTYISDCPALFLVPCFGYIWCMFEEIDTRHKRFRLTFNFTINTARGDCRGTSQETN